MNMPAPTPNSSLAVLIHEVSRLMKRRFEDVAGEQNLTMTQWRALGQISKTPGITQVAIASAIEADPMTVSGLLDRLEKRGLIRRYPAPGDSRAKCAEPTEAGMALFAIGRQFGLSLFENALSGVSAEDRDATLRTLAAIRSNLSGMTADSMDGSK